MQHVVVDGRRSRKGQESLEGENQNYQATKRGNDHIIELCRLEITETKWMTKAPLDEEPAIVIEQDKTNGW